MVNPSPFDNFDNTTISSINLVIAYYKLGFRKGRISLACGKIEPILLTFPPISLPPSGLQVDPREPSGD
jgi:hypothetical protein